MSTTIQVTIYFPNEPSIEFNFLSEKLNWTNLVTLIESSRQLESPLTLYYQKEKDTDIESLENQSQFESLLTQPEIKGLNFFTQKDLVNEPLYILPGLAFARLTQFVDQHKSIISSSHRLARWVGILASFIAEDTTDHHFNHEFQVLDTLVARKTEKLNRRQDTRESFFGRRHGRSDECPIDLQESTSQGESSDECRRRKHHGRGHHGFGGRHGPFGRHGGPPGAFGEGFGGRHGPFGKHGGPPGAFGEGFGGKHGPFGKHGGPPGAFGEGFGGKFGPFGKHGCPPGAFGEGFGGKHGPFGRHGGPPGAFGEGFGGKHGPFGRHGGPFGEGFGGKFGRFGKHGPFGKHGGKFGPFGGHPGAFAEEFGGNYGPSFGKRGKHGHRGKFGRYSTSEEESNSEEVTLCEKHHGNKQILII